MITTYSQNDQKWMDISSPTKDELDTLIMDQNLDPLIAKDLSSPTPKQYVKSFHNSIYTVLHIPVFIHKTGESLEQEIDFVISKDSLITTRYDHIDPLHHFAKELEVEEILNKKDKVPHLFFGLMKNIYKFLFDEIEYIKDTTKNIEKRIFSGKEKHLVFEISVVGRNLLTFERNISSQKALLDSLKEFGSKNFGEDFERELQTTVTEWERLIFDIKNTRNILDELRETNNSILSTKQNEIMKIFTILAFVTFPLSLIASIFGMNTEIIPLVGLPHDFWIVMAIMTMMSIAMFIYFKYKKWI
jgi:magnesium transporter